MKVNKWLNLILPVVSIIAVIVVWVIAWLITGSEYILPSVSGTLAAFFELFGSGKFYPAFAMTLLRSLIAFAVSFLLAFLLALLSKKSDKAERVLSPIISIIRALPTIAIVLLLLFWTNSNVAPIVVTSLVVFPTTYTGVRNVLDSVDEEAILACKVFGVSKREIFYKVRLPQITPPALKLIGSGLSLNIKLMVAAEVLSATPKSLGNMLNFAYYNSLDLGVVSMLALVLVVVIIGVTIEGAFNILSRKSGAWK